MIDTDLVDEIRWIEEARQGDPQAFEVVVERYQKPVFNLCYRMLGNRQEAEDAAQEAFFRAYRALGRYDPNRSFKTWLLSISSNYCIDQIRKRRLQLISIDSLLPGREEPDRNPGPEKMSELGEEQMQIQRMLMRLGEKDRTVIVLRYWYDMAYTEIAETLSMSVSAVKSRLHRARRELAEAWGTSKPFSLKSGGEVDEATAN